MNRTKQWFK